MQILNTEYSHIERMLETYSLDDILELNELTEADILLILYEGGHIELPNPQPVDV